MGGAIGPPGGGGAPSSRHTGLVQRETIERHSSLPMYCMYCTYGHAAVHQFGHTHTSSHQVGVGEEGRPGAGEGEGQPLEGVGEAGQL